VLNLIIVFISTICIWLFILYGMRALLSVRMRHPHRRKIRDTLIVDTNLRLAARFVFVLIPIACGIFLVFIVGGMTDVAWLAKEETIRSLSLFLFSTVAAYLYLIRHGTGSKL
jgi:hypothetical protein